MNDIFENIHFMEPHLYADDLQLIASDRTAPGFNFNGNVNTELDIIGGWCNRNFITLNSAKSKCITFNTGRDRQINFTVNSIAIQNVTSIKVLGFVIDEKLNFDQHIGMVTAKVTFLLRKVYNTGAFLPLSVRKHIAKSLLLSHITYGIEVYSGTNLTNLTRLRTCMNRIVRYVYNLGIFTHISPFLIEFLGNTFENFIDLRTILLFYRIMKFRRPQYLVSYFEFGSSQRTRSLIVPSFRTLAMQQIRIFVSLMFCMLCNQFAE
ncbi:uncharacterized protein LOC142235333 [Haematobia irritans]|uniref:uncharacterized protein LOC142235333 n=1 Tax=Haematobia irritans TaxID=7368 RepID=UPI003F4FEC9E